MGNNLKTWGIIISVVVTIVLAITGYIYAEATASRARDAEIWRCAEKEHRNVREEIHSNQIMVMSSLNKIEQNLSIVRNDVKHIKEDR